jgi:nicotinate-nucleotide--dimethylbenzimidazole phosphoribosyltransferase
MGLVDLLKNISKVDRSWQVKADDYLNTLAMPPGALGEVHNLASKLCAIYQTLNPQVQRGVLVLSAADHGVMAHNVSKYPQITDAIVKTALNNGAAINSFCRQVDCDLKIVNAGLAKDVIHPDLIDFSCGPGTADMSIGPAMSSAQCEKAVSQGFQYAVELAEEYDLLGLGEMGIGNTTAATAVICGLTGWEASEITGPGTGVEGAELDNKISVIKRSLALNNIDSEDGFDALTKVGGFEIAFMTGLILGFASAKKAIVLDGFITSAAAMAAVKVNSDCTGYLIAGHQSAESAHGRVLQKLGLAPVLQLQMRLGEGTGAALAMKTLDTACDILENMMTLDQALGL